MQVEVAAEREVSAEPLATRLEEAAVLVSRPVSRELLRLVGVAVVAASCGSGKHFKGRVEVQLLAVVTVEGKKRQDRVAPRTLAVAVERVETMRNPVALALLALAEVG